MWLKRLRNIAARLDNERVADTMVIVARGIGRPLPARATELTTEDQKPMRAAAIAATRVVSLEESTRRILVLALLSYLALC